MDFRGGICIYAMFCWHSVVEDTAEKDAQSTYKLVVTPSNSTCLVQLVVLLSSCAVSSAVLLVDTGSHGTSVAVRELKLLEPVCDDGTIEKDVVATTRVGVTAGGN